MLRRSVRGHRTGTPVMTSRHSTLLTGKFGVYLGRPRLTSKLIASRGGVWKYANAQWAFYPNGGGISTRGAVTPAWFYNRPFIRLTLMPMTQSLGNSYLFPKRVLNHGESSEEVPQFLWLFSQPFLLKEIQSSTLNLSHPFSLVPRLFRPNAGTE